MDTKGGVDGYNGYKGRSRWIQMEKYMDIKRAVNGYKGRSR